MLDIKEIILKENYDFHDLVDIMAILRTEEIGCPWDIEQTHKSIRNNFIEEVYEAVEAIDTDDADLLKEELGDVLMQVVFHAGISASEGDFNIDDVCDGVCKKLILRHPHVFGDVSVADSNEVLTNWDAIKRVEKQQQTFSKVLDDVARTLPSLVRAQKLRKKSVKAGMCSYSTAEDLKSVSETLADKLSNSSVSEKDIADILTVVVDVAQQSGFDAEQILYDRCEDIVKEAGSFEP